MGQTHSRRGGSAAPAAGPSRKRRHGQHTHARPPLSLHPVHRRTPHTAPVAFSSLASLLLHATAAPVAGPSLRVESPRPPLRGLLLHALRRQRQMTAAAITAIDASWRAAQQRTRLGLAAAHISLRRVAERARERAAPVALTSFAPLSPRTATAAFVAGPSLREDIPRPPLRDLILRDAAPWRGCRAPRRARAPCGATRSPFARAQERRAARVAHALARLDEHVWQPALWPFRPAQREMLAGTLASLSVAVVALGWIVAYNTLAPAPVARAPAPPPAPPKQITERVVSRALPSVNVPIVEVRLPVPAPNRRRR